MRRALVVLLLAADTAIASPPPKGTRVALPSSYKGKSYCSFVSNAQLDATPTWRSDRDQDPPLSPMKAKVIAQRVLDDLIPAEEERKKWALSSIMVAPVSNDPAEEPKGYYVITWQGPTRHVRDDEASKTIAPRSVYRDTHDSFRLVVLMDGTCVQPKEMTPNQAIDSDKK